MLPEIIEQALGFVRHNCQRCIIAHGADRFLSFMRHRFDKDIKILFGVTKNLQVVLMLIPKRGRHPLFHNNVSQFDPVFLQPVGIGISFRQLPFQFIIWHNNAEFCVNQQDFTGSQASLLLDLFRRKNLHPHFGSHDDHIIFGDDITGWP